MRIKANDIGLFVVLCISSSIFMGGCLLIDGGGIIYGDSTSSINVDDAVVFVEDGNLTGSPFFTWDNTTRALYINSQYITRQRIENWNTAYSQRGSVIDGDGLYWNEVTGMLDVVSISWDNITEIPAGFADGVDDDTTYTAGTGLNLMGTIFSFDVAWGDARYGGNPFDQDLNTTDSPTFDRIWVTGGNSNQWNTAYGWGNHALQNYFDIDIHTTDDLTNGTWGFIPTGANRTMWEDAYRERGSQIAGLNLTWNATTGKLDATGGGVGVESDPIFTASDASHVTSSLMDNWNTSYSWGDHSSQNYFDRDTDTIDDISNGTWGLIFTRSNRTILETIFGWGDHSLAGYLTSEADPWFNSSAASGITTGNITDWDTAYSWGDHSSQNYFDRDTDTIDDISNGTWGLIFTKTNRTMLATHDSYLNQAVKTTSTPTFTNLTLTGLTSGQVVFPGTGGVLSGSSNLFWDSSTGRLGIGTTSPTHDFHVAGVNAGIKLDRTGGGDPFVYLLSAGSTCGQIRGDPGQGLYFYNRDSRDIFHSYRTETVFNEPSNNIDFRVESDTNTHMLFVDAGLDRVGIGTGSPGYTLDVNGAIHGNDYYSGDGSQGWTGTFTNGDGATVTVKDGLITDVS